MSFILTVYMRDRILMAANETLVVKRLIDRILLACRLRSSRRNTFLLFDQFGVSVCGQTTIDGEPVSRYVQSLLRRQEWVREPQVGDIAGMIFAHFSEMEPIPDLVFHVAGYNDAARHAEQQVWFIDLAQGLIKRLNTEGAPGIAWDSSFAVLTREAVSIRKLTGILVITPHKAGWMDRSSIPRRLGLTG